MTNKLKGTHFEIVTVGDLFTVEKDRNGKEIANPFDGIPITFKAHGPLKGTAWGVNADNVQELGLRPGDCIAGGFTKGLSLRIR